jgi:hypothetical protein
MTWNMQALLFILLVLIGHTANGTEVEFTDDKQGTLAISIDGKLFADYVYQDNEILRPYFKSVHTPDGSQITRTQPPDPEKDITDHPLFHPGIWLSFGNLNNSDYWRLAAKTKFVGFEQQPRKTEQGGKFRARFQYLDQKDPKHVVCEELFTCQIVNHPVGTFLLWDSTFESPEEFAFGDQEEMGLGIRMATTLRSESQPRGSIPPGTGTILDAAGRKSGAEVWGQAAPWCDYSGTIDGQQVGATLFCHPDNFRPSWFHARDYGLLVANPFGRKAFKQGETSQVVVKAGKKLQLRYGILLHAGNAPDLAAAYQDYITLTRDNN